MHYSLYFTLIKTIMLGTLVVGCSVLPVGYVFCGKLLNYYNREAIKKNYLITWKGTKCILNQKADHTTSHVEIFGACDPQKAIIDKTATKYNLNGRWTFITEFDHNNELSTNVYENIETFIINEENTAKKRYRNMYSNDIIHYDIPHNTQIYTLEKDGKCIDISIGASEEKFKQHLLNKYQLSYYNTAVMISYFIFIMILIGGITYNYYQPFLKQTKK